MSVPKSKASQKMVSKENKQQTLHDSTRSIGKHDYVQSSINLGVNNGRNSKEKQMLHSSVRHSSASRLMSNSKVLCERDSQIIMSENRNYEQQDYSLDPGTSQEMQDEQSSISIDRRILKQPARKPKKAKRANTFMPDIHARKHPILGLPGGKIDAKARGKPYLPQINPDKINKKSRKSPTNQSISPREYRSDKQHDRRQIDPVMLKLDRVTSERTSVNAENKQRPPRLQPIEKTSPSNIPFKSQETANTSKTQNQTTKSAGPGRQEINWPGGLPVGITKNQKQKKNSHVNAKLPPILPQPHRNSQQNFNQCENLVEAGQISAKSTPVRQQVLISEMTTATNALHQRNSQLTEGPDISSNNMTMEDYNQQNSQNFEMQANRQTGGAVPPRVSKKVAVKQAQFGAREAKFQAPNSPRSPGLEQYEEVEERKENFMNKNLSKLRDMQERRAQELREVEEARDKAQRIQKKLEAKILKEAQAYKAKKDEEARLRAENGEEEVKKDEKPINVSLAKRQQKNLKQEVDEENLTEEQMEEREAEKQKQRILKKMYKNRYQSLLKALNEKKQKVEEDTAAQLEKEEKRRQKIRQKAIDMTQINSKVYDEKAPIPEPVYEAPKLNLVAKNPLPVNRATNHETKAKPDKEQAMHASSTSFVKPEKIRGRSSRQATRRSNSTTEVVNVLGNVYTKKKQGNNGGNNTASRRQGSRGSSRSDMNKTGEGLGIQKQRSEASLNGRQRTLTPKQKKFGGVRNPMQQIIMTAAEKAALDEEAEIEQLKQAEERKKRAKALKERTERQLQALKDKKNAKEEEAKLKEDRDGKLKALARAKVIEAYNEYQNQPGLREQQDSRNAARDKGQASPSAKKMVPTEMLPFDQKAIQNFYDRNLPNNQIFLNITDMAVWRKKYRVDADTGVFIIKGGYPDVKKALKKRGWVENKDKESPCFDFKWTLKTKDLDFGNLKDNQLVNHFTTATSITTKVGLTHSLRNLIWFTNVDIDTFYPKCYDCGVQEELEDFIQEFKAIKATSFLKTYVREMREQYELNLTAGNQNGAIKSAAVSKKLLQVAQNVCEKRNRDLDDLIDDPRGFEPLVCDSEWDILAENELDFDTLQKNKHEKWLNKNCVVLASRNKKKRKKKTVKQVSYEPSQIKNDFGSKQMQNQGKKGDEQDDDEYGIEDNEDEVEEEEEETEEQKEQDAKDDIIGSKHPEYLNAVAVIKKMWKTNPQFNLDGERNIWIVKPAGSSRGRGIVLYKNLVEIVDLVCGKATKTCDLMQWIVQKYIENPLLVLNRKFDIRLWVLITNWNPLEIWTYAEPYIRFPASDFSFDNISNRYAHLSNNSVCKNAAKVSTTHEIEGNMWRLDQLTDHLEEEFGYNVWEDVIIDKVKNVVINTMESVQDNFECKKGQFELFGFDIMLDQDFNAWLIEVNSSPAMDYSTDVTERLVKMVLEDVVKVVVDYGSKKTDKQKAKVDTGLFECIYRAKRVVEKPMGSFGLNLEVKGQKIHEHQLPKY